MAYRNVIFDLDGTLVDSLPGIEWSVDAALAAAGMPERARDLKSLIGPPIRNILAEVAGVSAKETLDRMERAFRSSYDSNGWRLTVCYPGVEAMLQGLSVRGIALWIVTNKPSRATRLILDSINRTTFFLDVVCRDSRTPAFRSKGEMLLDLMRRRHLDPATCLMVGDTLEDAHAAADVCIDCALVTHGYGRGLDPREAPGYRLLDDWSGLFRLCGISRNEFSAWYAA